MKQNFSGKVGINSMNSFVPFSSTSFRQISYVPTVSQLIQNVSSDRMIKLKIEAFDSGIKPLMRHQKPYFVGHETAVMKSLLSLRSQTPGSTIGHVVDDALLDFIDMVDPDLGTNILLNYVEPYVEERNRYDETQTTRKVPSMLSIVLTLKCLGILIRKLTISQIEFNLLQIAPLAITVLP